jgi:hypothetical protein
MNKENKVETDTTDIFGQFAIWAWGRKIPTEIFKLQRFIRRSPLGQYIRHLENEIDSK